MDMLCTEMQWIREAMIRQSLVMRGGDTAMLGNDRHRRSVDGTGSGTAKERCDVQRR